ncbi:LacI family DNA-binding transcriptional regulator [Luteococcus peritonei]|uniref:LacI family DNA-binding transcriptional regulator n=1 Tax=Luteococcus peritonei TaxID=88874 RepID=A0ABW4RX96_9ACTN
MGRKVTARDVAELAGVSRSAVSMVLNGRGDGDVSPENQEAIRQAAAQLRYRPNSVARSLRNQATHTIGVVTDSVASGTYGGAMIAAASRVAAEHDFLLLVVDSHKDAQLEQDAVDLLQARQCDALMFVAEGLVPWQPPAAFHDDPCLLVNAFDPSGRALGIYGDEEQGGREAARLVLDRGHREVVHLHGTTDVVAVGRRIAGYRQKFEAAGLPVRLVPCGWEIDDGWEVGGRVLDEQQPTAVVCANDRVAAGVHLAAAQRGLRIPEDLSVVGYDDDPSLAAQLGLSTVQIPFDDMGAQAMRTLLAHLDGVPLPTADVELPSRAVVRRSVAAPAARGRRG